MATARKKGRSTAHKKECSQEQGNSEKREEKSILRRWFDCVSQTTMWSGCRTSGVVASVKHMFYAAPGRANMTDDGRMTDTPTHDALDRNPPLYWLCHHSLSQATSRSTYLHTEPLSDSHSSIQHTIYCLLPQTNVSQHTHHKRRLLSVTSIPLDIKINYIVSFFTFFAPCIVI